MTDSAYRERLKSKSVPQLIKLAVKHFHAFIHERDKEQLCISCGSPNIYDASHYHSAGKHPGLRFNPDNVHMSCRHCNFYLSGNLLNYRIGLIIRIGQDRLDKLDIDMAYYKRNGYKWQRESLIETIIRYK